MKFTLELLLNKRHLDVWRHFENPENLKRWQPTLRSINFIQGMPGQEGSVAVLTYEEKGRKVVLEEALIEKAAPKRYVTTSNGVQMSSKLVNTFDAEGATQTRWRLEADYRFRGFSRFLSPLFKGSVRKQTLDQMKRFQKYVEST